MVGHLYITWKKTPFLRLFIALAVGVTIQWYAKPELHYWWKLAIGAAVVRIIIPNFNLFQRFKLSLVTGIATLLLFVVAGGLIAYQKDVRNRSNWFGHYYNENDTVFAVLQEPLIEKPKTYKAVASVTGIWKNGQTMPANGKIIVYFRKQLEDGTPDTSNTSLGYGSQIIFRQPLQTIRNAGNPGGFDYKRYCLFQEITHQVYLKGGQFLVLEKTRVTALRKFLFNTRARIVSCLQRFIPGEKEQGLAEALLIGYKNDLDRSLIQSYANTGVVHIIAISGLHLGLIYWLLVICCKPLKQRMKLKWTVPVIIIACLWLFSLLAGAQPSILRSAVMFTCIVLAENIYRKSSIFNTLACSAFILICINPFWLWDAGFQLSYAAIVGILVFGRPISNLFNIRNKLIDQAWRLNAVTLSAQVFTIPISIYHFHQFPNYFFIANLFAVPLSSIILLGEILLCTIVFAPPVCSYLGKLISGLIRSMNWIVEKIESLPGSVWQGLQISLAQTMLLTAFIIFAGYWILERSKRAFTASLFFLFGFAILRSHSFSIALSQRKFIVYSIPQKSAIDFISGRKYVFLGDSSLPADELINNFHLRPTHTKLRLKRAKTIDRFYINDNCISFSGLRMLLIDETVKFRPHEYPTVIDYLVFSKNPTIYLNKMVNTIEIRHVIFDSSVPAWKSKYWKKDCDSLRIPWHDVNQDGAFVVSLR